MRHSPARRSPLRAAVRGVRLADRTQDRPRHGGPIAGLTRPLSRRAVRLAIFVSMTCAGFCLVLAMVALVVAQGQSDAAGPATLRPVTQRGQGPQVPVPGQPKTPRYDRTYLRNGTHAVYLRYGTRPAPENDHPPPPEGPALRDNQFQPGMTLASYQGSAVRGLASSDRTAGASKNSGSAKRYKFRIKGPGDWGVSWKFRCPALRVGSFVVRESDGKATNGTDLSVSGPRGQGLSWKTHDPGDHTLTVRTRCSWEIKVVLPKRSR